MAPAILSENWRESQPALWLFLLKLSACLTLGARGWLTWQADSPIRGLFWQEAWWSSLLKNSAGIPWDDWAKESDPYITITLSCIGLILIAIAIVPWLLSLLPKLRWLLWLGAFSLSRQLRPLGRKRLRHGNGNRAFPSNERSDCLILFRKRYCGNEADRPSDDLSIAHCDGLHLRRAWILRGRDSSSSAFLSDHDDEATRLQRKYCRRVSACRRGS
jgi:hypothetical protein